MAGPTWKVPWVWLGHPVNWRAWLKLNASEASEILIPEYLLWKIFNHVLSIIGKRISRTPSNEDKDCDGWHACPGNFFWKLSVTEIDFHQKWSAKCIYVLQKTAMHFWKCFQFSAFHNVLNLLQFHFKAFSSQKPWGFSERVLKCLVQNQCAVSSKLNWYSSEDCKGFRAPIAGADPAWTWRRGN